MKLTELLKVTTPEDLGLDITNQLYILKCKLNIIESHLHESPKKSEYSIFIGVIKDQEVKDFIKGLYNDAGWKVSYFDKRIILSI